MERSSDSSNYVIIVNLIYDSRNILKWSVGLLTMYHSYNGMQLYPTKFDTAPQQPSFSALICYGTLCIESILIVLFTFTEDHMLDK